MKPLVLALTALFALTATAHADDTANVTITAGGLSGAVATHSSVVTFGNYPGTWVLYSDTRPFQTAWPLFQNGAMPVLNVVTAPVTSLPPGLYMNGTLLVPSSITPARPVGTSGLLQPGSTGILGVPCGCHIPVGTQLVNLGIHGIWYVDYTGGSPIPTAINPTTGAPAYVIGSTQNSVVQVPGGATFLYTTTQEPYNPVVQPPAPPNLPIGQPPVLPPNLWHAGLDAPVGNPGPGTPTVQPAEPNRADPSEHADLTNRGR